MERHTGSKALDQITGLLCLRLASADLAERGLSLAERGPRTCCGLRTVLPPWENFRAEPFRSGDAGGQMPGGGGSTGKVRTPVLPGFGKGQLLRLEGKRGGSHPRPQGPAGHRVPGGVPAPAVAASSAAPPGWVSLPLSCLHPREPAQRRGALAAGA